MLTWVALILTSLMYLSLTVFGLHNFFKYIVKQQNQLKLLYILAIVAAAGRLGRYIAMIVNMVQGEELHTQLSLMADLFISCLFVGAGMCLTLIMFKLYTYLHCWSIYLHEQRRTFDNNQLLHRTRLMQQKASTRFNVLKIVLHVTMVAVAALVLTQLVLVYTQSDFAGTSPMQVSAQEFAESQADLSLYSFLNIRMLCIESGIFFSVDAMLLYTSIFFLVSIMNDLSQQNTVMFLESSSSLENEKKRLKIIMTLFGTSYLVRSAFDMILGIYSVEFMKFASDYSGFFELLQCVYFIFADVVPLCAFFNMHHQVYGG